MNPNLIPEQRTDKNGVTKTRWVKATPGAATNNRLMPAPSLAASTPVNYYNKIDQLLNYTAVEQGDYIDPFLRETPSRTLAYVYEALMGESEPDDLYGQISYLMHDRVEPYIMEAYIHLYELHAGTMEDMMELDFLRGAIESGSNPDQRYNRKNPARVQAVSNLFKFVLATGTGTFTTRTVRKVNGADIVSYPFSNPELADYIMEHPERFNELLDIAVQYPERIRDRDKSGISMILEESKNWTPVSEGML